MIKVNGKEFRCNCGCNVFSNGGVEGLWICNSCKQEYADEKYDKNQFGITKFEQDIKDLKMQYPSIPEGMLGCYLCNFENQYICREHNGGCTGISVCKKINERIIE